MIHDGDKAKKQLDVTVVENPTNRPVTVLSFADLLAPGQSTVSGSGWNNLFEIRLSKLRRP
jgi:hypothetical protein